MRKLLLLLSLLATAPTYAASGAPTTSKGVSKLGNGFVYESLTKVGDKAIIAWPRLKVGNDLSYIKIQYGNYRYAEDNLGDLVCKFYGYQSGSVSTAGVTDANYISVASDGSVGEFSFGFGNYSVVYSAVCSNAPGENEPRNY